MLGSGVGGGFAWKYLDVRVFDPVLVVFSRTLYAIGSGVVGKFVWKFSKSKRASRSDAKTGFFDVLFVSFLVCGFMILPTLASFGLSWVLLGLSWALWGALGGIWGSPGCVLSNFWGHFW